MEMIENGEDSKYRVSGICVGVHENEMTWEGKAVLLNYDSRFLVLK